MNENKFLKCACLHCSGKIEFPDSGIGQNVACPHCGRQTMLHQAGVLPSNSKRSQTRPTIADAVLSLIPFIGAFVGLSALYQGLWIRAITSFLIHSLCTVGYIKLLQSANSFEFEMIYTALHFTFSIYLIGLAIAPFSFWIRMLIDCLKHERGDKTTWVTVLILLNFIGATIYFFVRKKNRVEI